MAFNLESAARRLLQQYGRKFTLTSERPNLVLTPDAKQVIKEWVLKPNPRMSEVAFIGVGEQNLVDKVYAPTGDFSPNSEFHFDRTPGSSVAKSSVDLDEVQVLFETVYKERRLDQILFFGHLHPTGTLVRSAVIDGKVTNIHFHINPRDSFLNPSETDFNGAKKWSQDNPNIKIPFDAIAANTDLGPRLRIYSIASLEGRSYKDLIRNKILSQTLALE